MTSKLAALTSSLPIHEWPSPDRALWTEAQQPFGIFDAPHRGADWAPHSWRKAERGSAMLTSCWATPRP